MRVLLAHVVHHTRARGERGAVLIIAIPALVMAIFAAALGVDIGRIAVDKRNDQSVADVAAIDTARALSSLSSALPYATYQSAAQTAAQASADRQRDPGPPAGPKTFGRPDQTVTATVGSIDPTTRVFSATGNSAVRVVASSILQHSFMPSNSNLHATSIAAIPYKDGGSGCLTLPCSNPNPTCVTPPCPGNGIAAFSVGSTLASLDTSRSYLDPTLKTMLGASGSLSAVSYNGLATGAVSLAKLQTALLAAGISVGTVSQLLTTDIKVVDLLSATASALGASTARTEINDLLAANISSTATVKLNQLVNIATPSNSAVLSGTINVYQLVAGAAEVMNGANFANVATGLNLGAFGTADVDVKVISPAQTGIGPVGTTAENSQGVVRLVLRVRAGVATALLSTLGTPVDVTLLYTVGEAKGTISSIVCGASPSMGVSATTASTSVSGSAGSFVVTASNIAASGPTALGFVYPGEFAPASKRAPNSTNSVASTTVTFSGGGDLAFLVTAALNPIGSVVATVLTTVNTAIAPALKALGIDIGAADVTAVGIYPTPADCFTSPTLAQ